MFDELAPGLEKVLTSGRSGVFLALCQACKRLSAKQGPFIEVLEVYVVNLKFNKTQL